MEVKDNLGRILAVAHRDEKTQTRDERGNADKAYRLEIAPMMDVATVLCGLLVVNHLF